MRHTPIAFLGIILSSLSAFASEPPPDSSFFRVDFGLNGSPVQAGWVAAKTEAGKVSGPLVYDFEGYSRDATIAGKIMLTVAGGDRLTSDQFLCARDRGRVQAEGDDFPLKDLYRDFITGPSSLTIGISGLKPGTVQKLCVYSFDQDREQTVEIKNVPDMVHGAGVSNSPKVALTGVKTSPEVAHTATLQVAVPSSGQIVFRVKTLTGGGAVINGLSLSEVKTSP